MAGHIRSNDNRENSYLDLSPDNKSENTVETRQQRRLETRLKNKTRRKLEKSSTVIKGDANKLMALVQECLVNREEIFPSEVDNDIDLIYEDHVDKLRELGHMNFENKDKYKFVPKNTSCKIPSRELVIFADCLAPYKVYIPGIPIERIEDVSDLIETWYQFIYMLNRQHWFSINILQCDDEAKYAFQTAFSNWIAGYTLMHANAVVKKGNEVKMLSPKVIKYDGVEYSYKIRKIAIQILMRCFLKISLACNNKTMSFLLTKSKRRVRYGEDPARKVYMPKLSDLDTENQCGDIFGNGTDLDENGNVIKKDSRTERFVNWSKKLLDSLKERIANFFLKVGKKLVVKNLTDGAKSLCSKLADMILSAVKTFKTMLETLFSEVGGFMKNNIMDILLIIVGGFFFAIVWGMYNEGRISLASFALICILCLPPLGFMITVKIDQFLTWLTKRVEDDTDDVLISHVCTRVACEQHRYKDATIGTQCPLGYDFNPSQMHDKCHFCEDLGLYEVGSGDKLEKCKQRMAEIVPKGNLDQLSKVKIGPVLNLKEDDEKEDDWKPPTDDGYMPSNDDIHHAHEILEGYYGDNRYQKNDKWIASEIIETLEELAERLDEVDPKCQLRFQVITPEYRKLHENDKSDMQLEVEEIIEQFDDTTWACNQLLYVRDIDKALPSYKKILVPSKEYIDNLQLKHKSNLPVRKEFKVKPRENPPVEAPKQQETVKIENVDTEVQNKFASNKSMIMIFYDILAHGLGQVGLNGKNVGKLTKAAKDITTIGQFVKFLLENTQDVIDAVTYRMTGQYIFMDKGLRVTFESIVSEYHALTNWAKGEIKFARDEALKNQFVEFIKKVESMNVSMTKPKVLGNTQAHLWNQIFIQCLNWKHEIQTSCGAKFSRPEPLWIHIFGSPGQGKTTVVDALTNFLYTYVNPGKKYNQKDRYSRNVGDEFWSGYKKQFMVTYNELYQCKMLEQRALTSNEIMSAVNSDEYNLNMADLGSKGNTTFESKLVISTSNEMGLPDNLGIVHSDALVRRARVVVRMNKSDNFADGDPDMLGLDCYNFTIMESLLKDSKPAVFKGRVMDNVKIDVLCDYVKHKWDVLYRERNIRKNIIESDVNDIISKLKGRRLETVNQMFGSKGVYNTVEHGVYSALKENVNRDFLMGPKAMEAYGAWHTRTEEIPRYAGLFGGVQDYIDGERVTERPFSHAYIDKLSVKNLSDTLFPRMHDFSTIQQRYPLASCYPRFEQLLVKKVGAIGAWVTVPYDNEVQPTDPHYMSLRVREEIIVSRHCDHRLWMKFTPQMPSLSIGYTKLSKSRNMFYDWWYKEKKPVTPLTEPELDLAYWRRALKDNALETEMSTIYWARFPITTKLEILRMLGKDNIDLSTAMSLDDLMYYITYSAKLREILPKEFPLYFDEEVYEMYGRLKTFCVENKVSIDEEKLLNIILDSDYWLLNQIFAHGDWSPKHVGMIMNFFDGHTKTYAEFKKKAVTIAAIGVILAASASVISNLIPSIFNTVGINQDTQIQSIDKSLARKNTQHLRSVTHHHQQVKHAQNKAPEHYIPLTRGFEHNSLNQGQSFSTAQPGYSAAAHVAYNISKNMEQCFFYYNDGDIKIGQILFIQGVEALMPKHYIHDYSKLKKIALYAPKGEGSVIFSPKEVQFIELKDQPRDMMKIIFGKPEVGYKLRAYMSLKKYLHEFKDGDVWDNAVYRLDKSRGPFEVLQMQNHLMVRLVECTRPKDYIRGHSTNGDIWYSSKYGYSHNPNTVAGDCGTPYVIMDNSTTKRLLGLHTSNNGTHSVFTPILMSDFDVGGDEMSRISPVDLLDDAFLKKHVTIYDPNTVNQSLPSTCKIEYAVQPRPFMPSETNIVESYFQTPVGPFDPIYEVKHAPAKLGGEGEPYMKNLLKAQSVMTPPISDKLFKIYSTQRHMLFGGIMKSERLPELKHVTRKIGLRDNIRGNPELHISGIDMGTSLGGFRSMMGFKKVDDIVINETEDTVHINPLLLETYRHIESINKTGSYFYPQIFTDVLKDEVRSLDRVAQAKTRLFRCGNLDDLLQYRKLFATTHSFMERNHMASEVKIGINMHSSQYMDMIRYLMGVEDFHGMLACDVEKWDLYAKQLFLCQYYYWWKNEFNDGKDEYEVLAFIRSTFSAGNLTPMNGGVMYSLNSNAPSGGGQTSKTNSEMNSWYHRSAIAELIPWGTEEFPFEFNEVNLEKFIRCVFYGDDSLIAVSRKVSKWFNMCTLKLWFKKNHDITITSPFKDSGIEIEDIPEGVFTDCKDWLFLKRTPHNLKIGHNTLLVPRLERESIEKSLLWMDRKKDKREQMEAFINTCRSALLEWLYYGRIEYEENRHKIVVTETKSQVVIYDQNLTASGQEGESHQVQITKFEDTETNVEQKTFAPILGRLFNPYPDQTPTQILSRKYKILEFQWGDVAIGTRLQTIYFPQALLSIPAMQNHIANFYYMRSGIQLEIKMNTSMMHVGALMVTWIPNCSALSIQHNRDMFMASGNHPVLLSASTQESAIIDIPWINPYSWVRVSQASTEIAQVTIWNYIPLSTVSANVTDNVTVMVFASFKDIHVAGYIDEADTIVSKNSRLRGNKLNTQNQAARSIARESTFKSASDTMYQAGRATTGLSGIIKSIPIIGGALSALGSFIGLLDKPPNAMMTQPVNYAFFRDICHGEGVDNSNTLSLMPVTGQGNILGLMGEKNDKMSISEIIQTPMLRVVYKLNNESDQYTYLLKPYDNLGITSPKPDFLAFMSGFWQYYTGSLKISVRIYTSPLVSVRVRLCVHYVLPSGTHSINFGDTVSKVLTVKGDHVENIAIPYLWHTPYRSLDDIITVPVMSIERLSDIVGPSVESDPPVFVAIWRAAGEDFMFKQCVEYQGDNNEPILKTTTQKKEKKHKLDNTNTVNQCADIQMEFRSSFNGIIDGCSSMDDQGCIIGENITSIRQMIKRYCRHWTPPDPTQQYTNTYPTGLYNSPGPFHKMCCIYKYWSGSRRLKVYLNSNLPEHFAASGTTIAFATMQNRINGNDEANGRAIVNMNQWPVLEYEIPWYCTLPYYLCNPLSSGTILSTYDAPKQALTYIPSPTTNQTVLIAAGDDMVFGHLLAPDANLEPITL